MVEALRFWNLLEFWKKVGSASSYGHFIAAKKFSPNVNISWWDIGVGLRIQSRMHFFKKIPQKALNRILTLANYSTGPGLLISSGIIDIQNNKFCE